MSADVADAAGGAAALGVGAPAGLLLAGGLEPRGEPALRVLDDDLANLAKSPGGDEVAGLLHQRVAGVIVREAVEQPGFLDQLLQCPGLLQVKGGRLVAQDVEPVLQRHLGRRKMHVVRRDDGDKIHPLGLRQRGLLRDHLLERAVAALGREKKVLAAGLGLARTAGECAAHQLDLAVDVRGDAVHRADERAAAAADHSVTNFSAHVFTYTDLIY